MSNTLSPEGARLLRLARDQILAHPDQFDMSGWDCGCHACIGGWVLRSARITWREIGGQSDPVSWIVARTLGFQVGRGVYPLALITLLTPLSDPDKNTDAQDAARRINAFLWSYGYPADDVTTTADPQRAVLGRRIPRRRCESRCGMSLQERAQQGIGQGTTSIGTRAIGTETTAITGKARVSLFPATRYGIVDGELVEVLGQDDLPGMSPVLWCSDMTTGDYVPVPTRQVKHFATAAQALQFLQNHSESVHAADRARGLG